MTTELRELLDALGRQPSERMSIGHVNGTGKFAVDLTTVADAPDVASRYATGDVYYSTQPIHERVVSGRGRAVDAVGLRELAADLDVKVGGMPDDDAAHAVIADLSAMLGSDPVAVVHSGHGWQPHWALDDDPGTDWVDETDPSWSNAAAALHRWGSLVVSVAERHGGHVDSVWDLARVLRVPGTINRKEPDTPVPTSVTFPGGTPVALGRLIEVLDEYGVTEPRGAASSYTDPDLESLATCGIPAGVSQEPVLRDVAWKLRCAGVGETVARIVWETIVSRTTLTRPDEPWTRDDFDRHWAGADRKITADEPAEIGEDGPPLPERIDWHALWADDTEEEWIVEPFLAARRLVAIYSAAKVGKSLLMLEIAAAVSTGSTVLDATPARAYRVLYVDFENDPRADIRPRLQQMGYRPGQLVKLDYLSFPTLAALDSARGATELLAAVTAWGDEVVVIDTVSRAVAGPENENDTWLDFYRHTGLALKRAGVALVRLDHSGKDESKGQRGGSAKTGDIDAVWRLATMVKEKTYRLDLDIARMPIAERTLTLHRETTPTLHHRVDAYGRAAALDAKVVDIIAALDAAGLSDVDGERKARVALKERGLTAGSAALREALQRRHDRPTELISENVATDTEATRGDTSPP